MGERNSSLTRVQPVFDELEARDATGRSWLPQLLALPEPGSRFVATDGALEETAWGVAEKAMSAPRSLLRWMVGHPEKLVWPSKAASSSATTNRFRRALFEVDPLVRAEALRLLERPDLPSRAWYVLEGQTFPDVFLRTADLMVVIEGKRTELAARGESPEWAPDALGRVWCLGKDLNT